MAGSSQPREQIVLAPVRPGAGAAGPASSV